ncbi:MAG: DUF3224 domain-containing protein [Pyrinomonadaceae bacterium]
MNLKNAFLLAISMLSLVSFSLAQTGAKTGKPEVKTVTKRATGTFEVKVTPVAAEENVGDPTIGRLALDKQFSGALTASSKGQMLGFQGELAATGGYVAMERLNGTLDGKKGGFLLQHIGTMADGNFDLNIAVVPGSGTGELLGIAGKMTIVIEGGTHSYVLDYTLPKAK